MVGHGEGGLGELLDQDDGDVLGGHQLADQLVELGHHQRGQPHGDLVQQQQLGVGVEGPGDGQHLLFAPGEPAGQLPVALAEDGEAGVALLLQLGHLHGPTPEGVHEEVLGHRQVGEDGPAFGDGADPPTGQLLRRRLPDLLAVQPDASRRRPAAVRS